MSCSSTLVTAAHFAYLAERTAGEDGLLSELKLAAAEAGIPPIWISPEQASLMSILLRLIGAQQVIEVGTLAGYSAIAMARALPDTGRVRTIELDPKHVAFSREWAARSDVGHKLEVCAGRGVDVLPGFADNSADAAFLDADKSSYPAYLEESIRIVRPGGLIMVDNAFAFGQLFDETPSDGEVAAVRRFNDVMAAEERVDGIIVPVGDGLWVAINR